MRFLPLFFTILTLSSAIQNSFSANSATECVQVTIFQDKASKWDYTIHNFSENPQKIEFVLEADAQVLVTVKPTAFEIKRNVLYSVNFSYYEPRVIRAEKIGEITLLLDKPRNCTVIIEPLAGTNLIANAGFEQKGQWGIDWGESAKSKPKDNSWNAMLVANESIFDETSTQADSIQFSSRSKRTGLSSLRINKGIGPEEIRVRSSAGIMLETGKKYLLSGYYQTPQPRFSARLDFAIEVSSQGKSILTFHDEYLNPLVYSEPNGWRRSMVSFEVPKDYTDAKATIYLAASDGPFEVYWDDLELRIAPSPARQYSKPLSEEKINRTFTPESVLNRLNGEKPPRIQIPAGNGKPMMVNGNMMPLYGFTANNSMGEWPATSAHRDFIDAGVKLHWVPINTTEVTEQFGGPVWKADGVYDFSAVDKILSQVLGYDPSIYVLLDVGLNPYPSFCDVHPEAAWVNANGKKSIGEKEKNRDEAGRKQGEALQHSLTAPAFRLEAGKFLQALGQHIASSPYSKAVLGIHIAAGADGQWFKPGWVDGFGDYDYSQGNLDAFRAWLKIHYRGKLKDFQSAWGNQAIDFDTAALPKEEDRSPKRYFLDSNAPSDRQIIDANRFAAEGPSETINQLAKAFKDGIRRPAIVTTYYPNKLFGMETWINQPYLDGIVADPEYGHWRRPGQTGEIATVPGSLRLHNKFFLSALDYRTENATSGNMDAHDFDKSFVITRGPAESAAVIRRDFGAALTQGGGAWHYSTTGNSWNSPDHLAYIKEACNAASSAVQPPWPQDRGQIAVFSDEEIGGYASRWQNYSQNQWYYGNYAARVPLDRSGLSWDHYLLSDLGNSAIPDYKMYLFLTSASLRPEQINYIQKNLQKKGKFLIFIHNAGWALGDGFEQNIQKLTDMRVKADLDNTKPQQLISTEDDSLSNGIGTIRMDYPGPLFYVEDSSAKTLACYAGTKKAGMAVKRNTGWTSIYIATLGGFNPQLLRNIAAEAAVNPIGPMDDVTYSGNGFLVIHALSAGEKTLRWSGASEIVDLITGETIAHIAESITFPMKYQETRWFHRKPAGK